MNEHTDNLRSRLDMSVEASVRSELLALPKAELHCHLEGTVTPLTLRVLAQRNNIDLRVPIEISPTRRLTVPAWIEEAEWRPRNFLEFIPLYMKITQSIQTAADVVYVAEAYLKSAVEENIRVAQLHFSPTNYLQLGRPLEPFFEGLEEASARARDHYRISLTWIFDIVRNTSTDGSETITAIKDALRRGVPVIGLGLGGKEEGFPAAPFKAAFEEARALGLLTSAHAGETCGPQSIWETVHLLRPERIGHGVSAVRDPQLMQYLRDEGVIVEVCPFSNILLGSSPPEDHPLIALLDGRISIVIGADDPGIFGATLTDNFIFAASRGASLAQLKILAEQSLSVATGLAN